MGVSKRIYTARILGQDITRLFEPKAPKPKKKRKAKKTKEKWPPAKLSLPSVAELEKLSQPRLF